MGGNPCRLKVILNSNRTASNLDNLCYLVEETDYSELSDEQWIEIAGHLNDAEDASNRATRAFLDAHGYTGPLDHSLQIHKK